MAVVVAPSLLRSYVVDWGGNMLCIFHWRLWQGVNNTRQKLLLSATVQGRRNRWGRGEASPQDFCASVNPIPARGVDFATGPAEGRKIGWGDGSSIWWNVIRVKRDKIWGYQWPHDPHGSDGPVLAPLHWCYIVPEFGPLFCHSYLVKHQPEQLL